MTRKLITFIAVTFAIFLSFSSLAYAAHRDCDDYCTTQECKLSIEAEHDFLGGCANFGFPGHGNPDTVPGTSITMAGKYCSNTVGVRNYLVNTMNCPEIGVCYGSGVLKCPTGNHSINITCVAPPGGYMEFELTRQHASCTRNNGTGFSVSCGSTGLVMEVW